MPTLNIEGKRVTVDDAFLAMSPDEQAATVDEIAQSIGVQPKSEAAKSFLKQASAATQNPAAAQYDNLPEWQKALVAGSDIVTMAGQGATFGFGDEAAAAMRAPFTDKTFEQEQAEQERQTNAARRRSGWAGTTAELAGGIRSVTDLARRGWSFAGRQAATGAPMRTIALGGMADGAILGGVQGFGTGSGFNDRMTRAGVGAGAGGVLGGAAPYVVQGARAIASPVLAPILARLNPQPYANAAISSTLQRSGRSTDDVVDALVRSQADDQGMFMVADAMGDEGARRLSSVARNPNDARQAVADALLDRQSGQGERLSRFMAEGFDATDTAAQRAASLTAARDAASDTAFSAARSQATPVDVSAAIQRIDDVLQPGVTSVANPGTNIANDTAESALTRARNLLTDGRSHLTDFNAVYRARADIADWAQAAFQAGRGNQGRLLRQVRDELDNALAAASQPYRDAMGQHAAQSRVVDAIEEGGRSASGRTRATDNIARFEQMTPEQKSAFRAGYADPQIARIEGASSAPTTNKARMLMSEKTAQEFPAFAAPGRGDQLGNRIAREQRMFQTANESFGNSKTAARLADDSEMAQFDPSVMAKLFSGRPIDAAITAATRLLNEAKGQTPGVLERVAQTLMETNPEAARRLLNEAVNGTARDATRRALAATILTYSGSSGSTAPHANW